MNENDDAPERILNILRIIAEDNRVDILYAAEEGPRARQIAHATSPYQVQFLYLYPRDLYLRLDPPDALIEYTDRAIQHIEMRGVDIFYALQAVRNQHVEMLDWLFSPIIYQEQAQYLGQLRDIARRGIRPTRIVEQWTAVARQIYEEHIIAKGQQFPRAAYLDVLTPLIKAWAFIQCEEWPPPILSDCLANTNISSDIKTLTVDLIEERRAGQVFLLPHRHPSLDQWIETIIQRFATYRFTDPRFGVTELLNETIRALLHIYDVDP